MTKPAFNDPALPVQAVVVARCRAALTALGYANADQQVITEGGSVADDTAPFCIVGSSISTGSAIMTDKDSRPIETVPTIRCYARSSVEAKQVAAKLAGLLTAGPLAVDGFEDYHVTTITRNPQVEPTTDGTTVYGQILTITVHLAAEPA